MVGSCTLIVKDKNTYRVHIIGGTLLGEIAVSDMLKLDKTYREKPDAANLNTADVYKILSASQCANPLQPNYSEFVGDRKWLVNLSTKSFVDTNKFVKRWELSHKAELEQKKRKEKAERTKKIKDLVTKFTLNAETFCVELVKALEGTSTIPYVAPYKDSTPPYFRMEYKIGAFSFSKSRHEESVQFFAPGYSDEYDLIRGKFDFNDIFLNYLKKQGWEVVVFKRKFYGGRYGISSISATKGDKTLFWHYMMKSDLSLVKVERL